MNFKMFSALLVMILALGCSKDDDPSFVEKLSYTWFITEWTYVDCDDPADEGTETMPANCDVSCSTFDFTKDMVVTIFSKYEMDEDTSVGTWSGDEDSFTICVSGDCATGAISFSGKSMTMNFVDPDGDGCDLILKGVR